MVRAILGCVFVVMLTSCVGATSARRAGGDAPERVKPSPLTAHVPAKLPGMCVDPLTDGDIRDATRPFDKHVQLDVRSEDLDGDGVVDTFVMPAWPCGDSCNRSAYVVEGGTACAHYVGTFPSTDAYNTLEHKTNGLYDLSVRPRRVESDGEMHCYNLVLAFDGTKYKEARHRECECKTEGAKCTKWED